MNNVSGKWPRGKHAPLTFMQEQLLYSDSVSEKRELLNLSYSLFIEGNLDIVALRDSFHRLEKRHEPLRTLYKWEEGTPVAVIEDAKCDSLKVLDLTMLTENTAWDKIRNLALRDASTPFDLEAGPVFRCRLVKFSDTKYALLLSMHHVVSDAWGMKVFCRDWSKLYLEEIGFNQRLPSLVNQCVDIALAQKRWLASTAQNKQAEYWAERFSKINDYEDICWDKPRLPVPYLRTSRLVRQFPGDIDNAWNSLKREWHTSDFVVYVACLSLVFSDILNTRTLVIGSLVANRRKFQSSGCMGALYNTIPLLIDFDVAYNGREVIEHIETIFDEALEHQELPFSIIQDHYFKETGNSPKKLTQIMVYFDNYPLEELEFHESDCYGVHFEEFPTLEQNRHESDDEIHLLRTNSDADICFFVRQGRDSKTLSVLYKTDLIDDCTARNFVSLLFETIFQVSVDSSLSIEELVASNTID